MHDQLYMKHASPHHAPIDLKHLRDVICLSSDAFFPKTVPSSQLSLQTSHFAQTIS